MTCSLGLCQVKEQWCNLHGETVIGEILTKEKGFILCICGLGEGI